MKNNQFTVNICDRDSERQQKCPQKSGWGAGQSDTETVEGLYGMDNQKAADIGQL